MPDKTGVKNISQNPNPGGCAARPNNNPNAGGGTAKPNNNPNPGGGTARGPNHNPDSIGRGQWKRSKTHAR